LPTVYDIPPDILIERLTESMKKIRQISPPTWTAYVKTGSHTQRPSQQEGWWYTRCASLLRKVYINGPIGLTDLESVYGGKKRVGYSGAGHRDAGGSIIRKGLQQLDSAGLVMHDGIKGRIITDKGRSLLDKLSTELFKELVKENPLLSRYQ
tara:strand:- start:6 stop:461 length:456 start_codon:yes stop_codon:yes gene_type:complete